MKRIYVRCAPFALAKVLKVLSSDENAINIVVSLEDGELLVSFEYQESKRCTNAETCGG